MRIEGNICGLDELSIGLFMAYGEDDFGRFHMTSFGFILFEINVIIYV